MIGAAQTSSPPPDQRGRLDTYKRRGQQLANKRSSHEPAWRDITDHCIPYRTAWHPNEQQRGEKRDSQILNNAAVEAAETQAAGMVAGITPPTKHWIHFGPANDSLAEHPQVKRYFHRSRQLVERFLHSAGFYRALHNGGFIDVGTIGTGGMIKEEGDMTMVPGRDGRRHLMPSEVIIAMNVGEYYIDVNALGVVDTNYRRLSMDVRQMVRRFGYHACSQMVRNAWDKSNYDTEIVLMHAVQPNDEHHPGALGRHGMRWASCWWEEAHDEGKSFLREWGYEDFPVLAPRWFTRRGCAYGYGPGYKVRGECRALQRYEAERLRITDQHGKPALVIEGDEQRRVSMLPGDMVRVPKGSTFGVRPVHIPPPGALEATEAIVQAYEFRIDRAFNVRLWRRLIDDQRAQRATAEEIIQTKEDEAILQGPLLANLEETLLKPAAEGTFAMLARYGVLPQPGDPDGPPPELDGEDVKVTFISPMHVAQQKLGLAGVRSFTAELLGMSEAFPEVKDRIDVDVLVDEFAKGNGVPPNLTRPKDEAEAMRDARAKMEQARQQGEAIEGATRSMRDLGAVNPDNLAKLGELAGPIAGAQGGAVPAVGTA